MEQGFKKACWFLSTGTIYTMVDIVLTASGSSIGAAAAWAIDSIDANRYNGDIDI